MLYIIDGGGHAWPGKPVPSMETVRTRHDFDRRVSVAFRLLLRQSEALNFRGPVDDRVTRPWLNSATAGVFPVRKSRGPPSPKVPLGNSLFRWCVLVSGLVFHRYFLPL